MIAVRRETCLLFRKPFGRGTPAIVNLGMRYAREKTGKCYFHVSSIIFNEKTNEYYEQKFCMEKLKKCLLSEKVDLKTFEKIVNQGIIEKKDNSMDIEDILLMLLVLYKNYSHYRDVFSEEYYNKVCTNLCNGVKLKIHYLYTSKMLIYTMNILTNVKLIDNNILDAYTNKCYYFVKIEEYEIDDLIHFISIFSKICILKKDSKFSHLKRFNWPLIKIICDKLTYNFDMLFVLDKNNAYSFKLRKALQEEIKHISKEGGVNRSNRVHNTHNDVHKDVLGNTHKRTFGKEMTDYPALCSRNSFVRDSMELFQNHGVNSSFRMETPTAVRDKDMTLLEDGECFINPLLLISKSLKELNYTHISLINEIVNKIRKVFLNEDKIYFMLNSHLVNKIFYIMQCYLFLKLEHHMFYKSVLNRFKGYLIHCNSLVYLFFLLSKNKFFPSKTVDTFDLIFLKNVKEERYNYKDLITLLESYAIHKYRKCDVIDCLLSRLRLSKVKISMGHHGHIRGTVARDRGDDHCNKWGNESLCDKIRILHSLFLLDIYEEELIQDLCNTLTETTVHTLSHKLLIKILLTFSYFSIENYYIYNLIIKNLIKYDIIIDNVYLTQLKICELALRTEHVPNVYMKLDVECLEYMNYIRNKEKNVEYNIKSYLQSNVKNILLSFNLNPLEEIPIGPYNVDFVEEDHTFFRISKNFIHHKGRNLSMGENASSEIVQNESNMKKKQPVHTSNSQPRGDNDAEWDTAQTPNLLGANLKSKKLIVEVNGEHHFYRNSKTYTSLSKLKHKLLSDLGYVVVNIPYFDWGILKTDLDKKAYIKKLLSEKSNIYLRNVLPLRQKIQVSKQSHDADALQPDQVNDIKQSIQQCKHKTEFLNSIREVRRKNKLRFLKRKVKRV
ncbi:hypothetical protein POVWA2_035140 [Plasmodium ovale wallikeri]|uniref:RAP domain-containing protein n=2 Tax=Plasmodium ovale TaxID=36330 RepID=A0A1A8Z0U3_PLAOA|nr:hypothetical protein POVWA1_035850 [Plasmodium ovale wallikeri]SBT38200.1 hypothetical protein POVWA2_035140 [Plasmodium ovale wallikeri]SBT77596.1 RAP protein, putative [Plasmodium ovale]